MEMRIVITAGGTAGHINPLLSVAEELRKAGAKLLYVGGLYGPEKDMAEKAGLEFFGVNVRGLDRSSATGALYGLLLLPFAIFNTWLRLLNFKPNAVLAAGGYASAPSAIVAAVKGIPLYLMEQNLFPGLVTRKLAGKAKQVFTSFDGTGKHLPEVAVNLTGNPVRAGFDHSRTAVEAGRLLVMGGSQGAVAINKIVVTALPMLNSAGIKITHQTGKADYHAVAAEYKKAGGQHDVRPFIEDVQKEMAKAELAVCRAGASTCAELAAAALPSILIPYRGAGGHQRLNADAVANIGGAEVMAEQDATAEKLAERVAKLIGSEALATMSKQLKNMATPDAAKKIAETLMQEVSAA